MAEEKLKFLFVPVDGIGHFNASFGIASVLVDRGHSVTFAAPPQWMGKLKPMGFEEEMYTVSDELVQSTDDSTTKWIQMISDTAQSFSHLVEVHKHFYIQLYIRIWNFYRYAHEQFKQIVERVKPNAIILDIFYHVPALMETGIPWINLISIAPLAISRDNVPPPYAGIPTEGDPTEWKNFETEVSKLYKNLEIENNQWLKDVGSKEVIQFKMPYFMKYSPHANIYMYPEELDYTAYRQNPPNFYRFDALVRKSTDIFEIPAKLETGRGKLIYFSMGTVGSVEIGVMKKLLSILSKSPNRFIICKGARGDELELGDNMWGANRLPQLAVIPLVDLVITHGGNNTITECFYFGKRVLVLPMLFDQLDNAQRIQETGHGLGYNPYKVTEDELLGAIETLLGNDLLERRMTSISRRIQASNSQSKAADLVEKIARKHYESTKFHQY